MLKSRLEIGHVLILLCLLVMHFPKQENVFYVLCPLKDEEGNKENAALALTKADFGKP